VTAAVAAHARPVPVSERALLWAVRWRALELVGLWLLTYWVAAIVLAVVTGRPQVGAPWYVANGAWLAGFGWVAFLSEHEPYRRERKVVAGRWSRACRSARAQTRLVDGQRLPWFTSGTPNLQQVVVSPMGNVSGVAHLPPGMSFDQLHAALSMIESWYRPEPIALRIVRHESARYAIVELTHWRAFSGASPDPILYVPGAGVAVTEAGGRFDIPPAGEHVLIVGQTGAGKSSFINGGIAEQVQSPHRPELRGIDLKRVELGPWAGCFERLAVTPEDASVLLSDTVRDLDRRLEWLDRRGLRKYRHGCGLRPLTLVIDELVQAVWQQWEDEDPRAPGRRRAQLMKIAALGRAAGVQIICATQEPVAEMVGRIRVNMQTTICCRVRTLTDAEVAVGKGLAGDLHPENLTLDGAAWAVPATTRPVLVRARWLDDADVARIAAAHQRRP
jgi:hypothetical protein